MDDIIKEILVAPTKSPILMAFSIVYMIVESISIYDVRLLQSHMRGGLISRVSLNANGRVLPNWVGYFNLIGWALLFAIIIINWKYAIALKAFLFLLKFTPVLERIGEFLMSNILDPDDDATDDKINQLQNELIKNQEELALAHDDCAKIQNELELQIYSLNLNNKREDFVPKFQTWWRQKENQKYNLETAAVEYIDQFNLWHKVHADEPEKITRNRSILEILDASNIAFKDDDQVEFELYKTELRLTIMNFDIGTRLKKLKDENNCNNE